MKDRTIIIIVIILIIAYLFYTNENKSYSIPSEYKGTAGLDYMRKQYASQLSQAKSFCINQFKGEWIDSSNEIGCHNMQGFSASYCNMGIIQNIKNLCDSIKGNPVCSSTQATCIV
jgi:hypothetical protein